MSNHDLQALIADIDSVLSLTNPKIPQSARDIINEQRQILERVRSYLIVLQRQSVAMPELSQAVVAQMEDQLTSSLQPALEALQLQRQLLLNEIQVLEQQRESLSASADSPSLAEELSPAADLLASPLAPMAAEAFAGVPSRNSEFSPALVEESVETIQALTDLPKGWESNEEIRQGSWYLGIYLEERSLAAVLLNAKDGHYYPLYWSSGKPDYKDYHFYLPTAVYAETPNSTPVIGASAYQLAKQQSGVFFENCQFYLQLAVPYYLPTQGQWEPQVEGTRQQPISLYRIHQALQTMLATLTAPSAVNQVIGAVGLSQVSLTTALEQLKGVILNCPATGNDTYCFNLREAVIKAGLVGEPEQIVFVNEATATLLAHLPKDLASNNAPGTTLVVAVGGSSTELALVERTADLQNLSYRDLKLHCFDYGKIALEQDILCQLIYPQWRSQLPALAKLGGELPQPGSPDCLLRDRLNRFLYSQPEGYSILEATRRVKQILQQRKAVTSRLGELTWEVNAQELEEQVIHPFLNLLEQQLALLLQQVNCSKIDSIVCSGEAALLIDWLQQQFPEASVSGDTFKPISSLAIGLAHLPCFPGLLDQPKHQYSDYFLLVELLQSVSESSFSFEELMQQLDKRGINTQVCAHRFKAFLKGDLPEGLVPTASYWFTPDSQHYFEEVRGSPAVSRQGLSDRGRRSSASPAFARRGTDDQQITRLPLFSQENERYRPHWQQCQRLRQYLTVILSQTQQKLQDPLVSPPTPHPLLFQSPIAQSERPLRPLLASPETAGLPLTS